MRWLWRDPVEILCRTLDAEREALLRGDHDTLMPLLDRKERELTALGRAPGADPEAIRTRVLPRLERNRDLLEAAADGLRAARDRLQKDSARGDLCTYDADGARNPPARAGNRLERRA